MTLLPTSCRQRRLIVWADLPTLAPGLQRPKIAKSINCDSPLDEEVGAELEEAMSATAEAHAQEKAVAAELQHFEEAHAATVEKAASEEKDCRRWDASTRRGNDASAPRRIYASMR